MLKTFTDMLGESVTVKFPPERIVSLVPSITELLFDLGLENKIVGRTKFCNHPAHHTKYVYEVGGTKDFNPIKINQLNPDLVLGNKEENTKDGIEVLRKTVPVWVGEVTTLEEALFMIEKIGEITNSLESALKINDSIANGYNVLNSKHIQRKVAYLIWRKPYMTIGEDTFIHHQLSLCGFNNVFSHHTRYPIIEKEDLQLMSPDIVFLSSEPYPFKEKHKEEFQAILPQSKIVLVDGEMFSWFGSRLQKAPKYFNTLLKEISDVIK